MWQGQTMYAGNADGLRACVTFVVGGPWFRRAASTVKTVALLLPQPVIAAANLWIRYNTAVKNPRLGIFGFIEDVCVLIYFLEIV